MGPAAAGREAREDLLERHDDEEADLTTVPRLAVEALLGENPARRPDPAHTLGQVSAQEVRDVADQLHRSALVRAPDPGLDWAGYDAVPSGSTWAVEGAELLAVDGSDEVLVLGEEGVTRHSGFRRASVRYDDVALLQRFADGGRWLTGCDGTEVRVEPHLFGLDTAAVAAIDDAVDPAHVVHLPARAAERVPGANRSALVELKESFVRATLPAGEPGVAPPPSEEGEPARERRGLSGLFRRRER